MAAQLARRGYTVAAIGRGGGVTPQTAARWVSAVDPDQLLGIVEDEPHNEPMLGFRTPTTEYPVPEADADQLVELQLRVMLDSRDARARSELDLLCAQLRARGYTGQAIGNVLDVSREMVRQRTLRVPDTELEGIVDEVALLKSQKAAAEREAKARRALRERLTAEEVARALQLQPLAASRRAGTPPESEVGTAYSEYMSILFAAERRGVSRGMMGRQLGQTMQAIKFRMQRVTGDLPPSLRPGATRNLLPPEEALEALGDYRDLVLALRLLLRDATSRKGRTKVAAAASWAAFDSALVDLVERRGVDLSLVAAAIGRRRDPLRVRISAYLAAQSEVTPTPAGTVLPSRSGRLADFGPGSTPVPSAQPPTITQGDPTAQWESNIVHMALVRALRQAATKGGHSTQVWDLGQDVSFTMKDTLVNVEVKSIGGDGSEQHRLGLGQLLEQLQHHLDHLSAGTAWYQQSRIKRVVGVLVVSDEKVPPVWERIARRLDVAIWPSQVALDVFADTECPGLPSGLTLGAKRGE